MFNINLIESHNYDSERLEKLNQALEKIEEAINSDSFRQKVLAYKFFFRKKFLSRSYIDEFHTSQQVYEKIMKAVEDPGNVAEGSMDLYLNLVEGEDGSVIGYGNDGEKEIFTYKRKFDEMVLHEIANHITHEWTHKLGFTHAFIETPIIGKRDRSVPYAIGNIVEEIING